MKYFVKHILKIAFLLVISAFALDFFYTTIFEKSLPRTKFQNLRALKNQSVDYVFLGSSRVENGIIPELIQNKTGKSAMNLGFQASKMADIYLILQLLDEYQIKYKKAFIQVDYIFNIENGFSNVLSYEVLPFIHEELIDWLGPNTTVNPEASKFGSSKLSPSKFMIKSTEKRSL